MELSSELEDLLGAVFFGLLHSGDLVTFRINEGQHLRVINQISSEQNKKQI
jgi:hypothetical protein